MKSKRIGQERVGVRVKERKRGRGRARNRKEITFQSKCFLCHWNLVELQMKNPLVWALSLSLHLSVRKRWSSPNEVRFILTYSMKSIINFDAVVNVIQLIVHKEIFQANQMVYATISYWGLRNLCIHFQLTFQHFSVSVKCPEYYIMCVISACLRANFFDWKRLQNYFQYLWKTSTKVWV